MYPMAHVACLAAALLPGARSLAAGSIIDRSGGKAEVGAPRVALATLEVVSYQPEDCPLCRQGLAVIVDVVLNHVGASGEKAFPDGYRLLDPARIFHVHLRDYAHTPDGKVEWRAVGEGEFDNLGQIRALLKTGYKDNFTLETHWKSPKGKAFATRTSLTALLKVIEKV